MQLAQIISSRFKPLQSRFSRNNKQTIIARDGVCLPAGPVVTKRPKNSLAKAHNSDVLKIPCPDPTAEDRERDFHQQRGQRLSRQEQWTEISKAIQAADRCLRKTEGGMPVADLIGFGARADVVNACEHALISGKPEKDAPILADIEELETVLAENPSDYAIATVVAHAHMDMDMARQPL